MITKTIFIYIEKEEENTMEMMLKTNELCKTFKDQKAVNKVSLNIPDPDVYLQKRYIYESYKAYMKFRNKKTK